MKTALVKRIGYLCVLACILVFSMIQKGLGQTLNTPYPIIFVHGLNSDNKTWGSEDQKFDNIIDYLDGAGLKFGGNLNIALCYKRSADNLTVPKEEDVHLFTDTTFIKGDFYTINFNTHTTNVTPQNVNALNQPAVNSLLLDSAIQLSVTFVNHFLVNDIICVDSEFMQVININGSVLTVKRGLFGSQVIAHLSLTKIFNLSDESNQASIAKQGYAIKLAIDAIKQKTGASKVVLVGHSMGGLAAREYLRSYTNNNVGKLVTIGTPHYGADITKLPDLIINLPGIDGRSDAVRDLRASFGLLFTTPGVYLFGGAENSITGFYNNDVNSNGSENDYITGLNQNYTSLNNLPITYIVSKLSGLTSDGFVSVSSQYINNNDTIMTNRPHIDSLLGLKLNGETSDYYSLLRGLDEPSDPALAYEIAQNSVTKGFITFGQFNNPVDIDLFKIKLNQNSLLALQVAGNKYTGIKKVNLLDSAQNILTSITNINNILKDTITKTGTYFIQIRGIATNGDTASYKYPYTLTTTATAISPATLTTIPANSLNYYDVVNTQFRDTTIQLTNNGTSNLSVSNINLSGANADQFSITSGINFTILPGKTQNIKIRFSPTSTGFKTSTLNITNNSADIPLKAITLQGNGKDHATKTLIVLPDDSFNFGNKTITESSAEAFTLTNTGSTNLTISRLSISGLNPNDFSLSIPATPPYEIPSNGGSSIIVANFKPGTIGSKTGKLVIVSDADNKSPADTVTMYGNGTNSIYTGITGYIAAYEYWFDDNYTGKIRTPVSAQSLAYLNANFPTKALTTGPHTLHIRYLDQNGEWSPVVSSKFVKPRNIIAYEYWFDSNYIEKVITSITSTPVLSINADSNTKVLNGGRHTYNIRYKDDDGQWSAVQSNVFYKASNIISYEYWFDNNYSNKIEMNVPTPTQSVSLNTEVDTKGLKAGKHNYSIRYLDNNGQYSAIVTGTFYKQNFITAYRYWLDTDDKSIVTVGLPNPVNPFILSTNVSSAGLSAGNHTVHFQFKDINSLWSSVSNDTSSFQKVEKPVITAFNPTIGKTGTLIKITGSGLTGTTSVKFGSTQATSFTVVSDSIITATVGAGSSGNVTLTTVNGTASLTGFNFVFDLPANNFTISTTSASCKGVADGAINVTTVQSLDYTATVTGGNINQTSQFKITDTISNLTAGTYHLCITVQGQTNYQQCYDLTIDQPKDLAVYSVINDINNTLTLQLNNGSTYFIQLNGSPYTTSNNSITLPLKNGDNALSVTTDKLCQGTYQTVINLLKKIIPFPDPFENILSINLGNEQVDNVLFEVHDMGDGKVLYTKQMANQSGMVQLDLTSLKEGVYALYIKLDSIQQIYKIVKK